MCRYRHGRGSKMENQQWRQWLDESRAKQAQLNAQNYAMPSWGQASQSAVPMRGNSGEGWGTEYTQGPVVTERFPSQVNQHAPGYQPGIGSMTPDTQLMADNEWERQNAWRQQELDKVSAHIAWGDPRIQAIINGQVPAGTYGGVTGPVQPLQMAPQQTASQLADWERYQQIMADRRPWQGLR